MNTTLTNDNFLNYALVHDFGDIHCHVDTSTGMRAIIAIHNTNLGPALGGCRFIHYPTNYDALYDAMRLARGMSYKSALAQLPLGGGKAVIIQPTTPFDREAYFKKFGQWVQQLNGRYITALDSGTQLSDMDIIATQTSYVASLSCHQGDPSPHTAQGILRGIQAAVAFKLKKDSLKNLHIAIQGIGHVGYTLAKLLHEHGARLSVADVDPMRVTQAVQEFNAQAVPIDKIHAIACDVFSPCALGAIINDKTLNEFKTTIIAGAANNQLEHTYHGQKLYDKGILYATDYVINAGGVIFAASKYFNTDESIMHMQIDRIYDTLLDIFSQSTTKQQSTNIIADSIAQARIIQR